MGLGALLAAAWLGACAATPAASGGVGSQEEGPAEVPSAAAPVAAASAPESRRVVLRWRAVPRVSGRITAQELGLVINDADPYSVEVGEYYARRRNIPAEHVLHVTVPMKPRLSEAELGELRAAVDRHFPAEVQALALAWTLPYAARCQSITGALAFGIDARLCAQTCDKAQISPYFNSPSVTPFKDFGWRPSMLLAARNVALAKQLIDRGVQSDHTLGLRGAPAVEARYIATSDKARSVRAPLFPPPGEFHDKGVRITVQQTDKLEPATRLILLETGTPNLGRLNQLDWAPGALADHLTSSAGLLDNTGGQTTALAWLEAGATASYGTVSEPCNHLQKFPHPQLLLLHYLQGQTALEAYWKSVAWPQQGVFVGEPLAAPFARAASGP